MHVCEENDVIAVKDTSISFTADSSAPGVCQSCLGTALSGEGNWVFAANISLPYVGETLSHDGRAQFGRWMLEPLGSPK